MRPADVLLSDGSTVHVRPINPDDADAVVALHSRLSQRTRYLRYFSPYPRIPDRELARFVNVDHRDREAIVVSLGDDLMAIGRYDRLGPDASDAEVAFVVEDAHQGRGVGSVLLEHLAAAAREAGVVRFVAEVLPENGAMQRIFADAGFEVSREYADGVVHLRFPIAPTSRSVEVQRTREQRTEAASLARLLMPRSVAIYGVRRDGTGVGAALLRHVTGGGFSGAVYPIHPTASTLEGLPAYRTATATPGPVDMVLVALPARQVPGVVDDAARAGAQALVIFSAGFAEAGEAGAAAQRDLVAAARGSGLRVVGPNCMGVINTDPALRLNASLASVLPERGRVGLFCQSAALGVAVLAESHARGVGLSSFVSVGNRGDVSGNDLLQYWTDDPHTDVVLMYLETFGNPRKFARIARELGRDKPIVAVAAGSAVVGSATAGSAAGGSAAGGSAVVGSAVGGSAAGGSAAGGTAAGGTAVVGTAVVGSAVVGSAVVGSAAAQSEEGPSVFEPAVDIDAGPGPGAMAALLAQSGVIRVATVAELFDVGQLLARQPLPTGGRVGIVGNAGALVALASGACTRAGLAVAALGRTIPPEATPDELRRAVRAAVADEATDAVVVVVSPPLPGSEARQDAQLAAIKSAVAEADKPIVAVLVGAQPTPGELSVYATVEDAVRALAHVARYAAWRREPLGRVPDLPNVDAATARTIVGSRGKVDELLAAYGVSVVPTREASDEARVFAAADELGYPVAVKAAQARLRHRPDLGAVRLDVADAVALRRTYAEIARTFGPGVLVQPMVPPGVACVVELFDHPAFGPVVGFGLGGVATELLGDRAWRTAPLTDVDAAALVRSPRAAALLQGYRGLTPVDEPALADLLMRLGRLADEQPEVRRLVLNPVLAHASGLSVVHATLDVGDATARPDTGPRRLR